MTRALVVVALVGCGGDWLQYAWDDQRVLCSLPVDDLTNNTETSEIDDQLDQARDDRTVALMHGHRPEVTLSLARLEHILDGADARGLEYLTFAELVRGEPRPGIALAFDDEWIDEWTSIRELLASHGARVTFFVTRFHNFDERERGLLADLVSDGHAVEAHAVDHLNAPQYVQEHGMAAYVETEVLPSVRILEDAGYPVGAFAYPFGASNGTLDTAVLEHLDRVRVGPSSCPF